MSEANGNGPKILEGPGRYVVYEAPDGSWVVARATGICDTCRECGCGEQAEAIQIPRMVIDIASKSGKQRIMSVLKAAARSQG